MSAHQPKTQFMFKCLMLAISLGMALLLVEWVLRILYPRQEVPRWLVVHERYGHFQRRDFTQRYDYRATNVTWLARLNNLGLRGPDLDLSRTDDRRILFVGDSFTFGYGLEEEQTFPFMVGTSLNGKAPPPWTVINAGVGGWGTLQALTYATDHLIEFRPDVVVLTFCDNDLQDDVLFTKGKGVGLLPSFPGKQWLRDHSWLYATVYARLAPLLFQTAIGQEGAHNEETRVTPGVPLDQSNPGGPDLIVPWAAHWPRTLDAIQSFHARLMAQNPRALMIVQQAQPLRADIFYKLRGLDNHSSLRHLHLGLDVKDWPDRNVLLPYDPHWKPAMHELSARRLVEIIDAHEALP